MKNKNTVISLVSIFALALVFGASFISAAVCVGQDCSVHTTITIGNSAPAITTVTPPATITLTGGTTKVISVTFIAEDTNGNGNLNFSSAQVILSKTGETGRASASCANPENASATSATLNCTVTMQFYDSAGSWTVNATIKDLSNVKTENSTSTSTVNALDYVSQDITTMEWPSVTAGTNDNEASAPLILTNGGNQNYNNISIKAYNATGAIYSNVIPANNFSVDSATGQTTGQVYMSENTYVQNAELTGLNSHGAAVTENAYFYVDLSDLQPDTYTEATTWSTKVST